MIVIELKDLEIIKRVTFKVEIDPVPWAMGPIRTQGLEDKYTKQGTKAVVEVGEDPAAARFKESFSKQAVGHRISSNSPLYKSTPIFVCFDFFQVRPEYIGDKPALPLKRPDATNLQKLAEDTLTGLFWADDNVVVNILTSKRYVKDKTVKPYIITDIYYTKHVEVSDG